MHRDLPRVAALDLLACLVMVFAILALIAQPKAHPPTIRTPGVVAVILTWTTGSNNDIDLWVQDPKGNLVWFSNREAAGMYLEHDDQGTLVSQTQEHVERTVIRTVEPGEYTVNVHFYAKNDPGDQPVRVELWRTNGTTSPIVRHDLVLHYQGQEETVFRFTLSESGAVTDINHLNKRFVGDPYPPPGMIQ